MANQTEPKTLQQAIIYFSNPKNCLTYLTARRWPDGVTCPTCGRDDVSFLEKQNKWQCKSAHKQRQFSAKVGTIFEDSPLGLDKWLAAVWLIVNAKNGVSSYEIHRGLGVTQKTAWFMLQRIRLAMQSGSFLKKMNGHVEVDETFVGGKFRNMHASKKQKLQLAEKGDTKTAVLGMLDRTTREVRTKVIPNVKRATLQAEILKQIVPVGTVYTDSHYGYDGLKAARFIHKTVNHLEEYVRGDVHTQGIENFWSLLKRTLNGTYVAVEPFHLERYADEQAFRFNNRKGKKDADRFMLALSQVTGRRLTYAELTGKVGESAF